jgi:hypothetical protein
MKTDHRSASHAKRRYQSDPASICRVMERIQPFTPDELLKLELPIRMAFEAIKTGRGTLQDISDIGVAINSAMVRAESLDPLCLQTAIAARDALLRCLHRHNATGKVGFDGPAIADVDLGIDLHEQLLRLSTPLQMADALREVQRRTANKETLQ